MLNAYKNLSTGNLAEVNKSFAYPLMRWLSGNPANLEACEYINTKFFSIPPEMVISLLYLSTKKGFVKYPKRVKDDKDDKFYELMRKSVKQLYSWSETEYTKNKVIIEPLFNDDEYVKSVAKQIGFSAQECKLAGIKIEVKKLEYKKPIVGLDAFM